MCAGRKQREVEWPSRSPLVWHVTSPDVQEHTVLRSICQRRPSSTPRPSQTHPCFTHSHPSRCVTRDCRSAFCFKPKLKFLNASWNINLRRDHYLSFDHVQHMAQLLQRLLQLVQPVVRLYLRDTVHSLRSSRRPQRCCSLLLVALDVLGIMAALVVWLKFTERYIVMKTWTVVMRPRKVIWRRQSEMFILFSRNNLILNKHPGDQCLNEDPCREITNTVWRGFML